MNYGKTVFVIKEQRKGKQGAVILNEANSVPFFCV